MPGLYRRPPIVQVQPRLIRRLILVEYPTGGGGGGTTPPVFVNKGAELDQISNAATWTLGAPASIATSNLLVALLANQNDARTITGAPSGWNLLDSSIQPPTFGSFATSYTYWKIATGSEPATYDFTWDASTGSNGAAVILQYSGNDPTAPIDQHRLDEVDVPFVGTDITSGAITPSVDNCLIVTYITSDKGAAALSPQYTEPAGFAERFDFEGTTNDVMIAGADLAQTTATSVTVTWTPDGNQPAQVFLFAIKPAPGGGGSNLVRTVTDALGLSDSVARAGTFLRALTDALQMADALTRIGTFIRSVTQGLTLSDSAVRVVTNLRSATDALNLADAAVRIKSTVRTATDALGLGDAVTRTGTFIRSVTDALTLGDAATRVATSIRTAADALSLADAATRIKTTVRTAADALSLGDSVARVGTFLRSAADALTLADAAVAARITVRTVTDALGLSDAATRTGTFIRTAADALTLNAVATRLVTLARTTSDALGLADVATRAATIVRSATELINLLEGTVYTDTFTRSASNALGGDWSLTAGSATEVSVDGSKAVIVPGGGTRWVLPQTVRDADMQIGVIFGANSAPGGENRLIMGIDIDVNNRYATLSPSVGGSAMNVSVGGGLVTSIGAHSVGSAYWFKMQVRGTVVAAKAWLQSDPEPSAWTVTGTCVAGSGVPTINIGADLANNNLDNFTLYPDTANRVVSLVRSIADALTLADVPTRAVTLARSIAQSLSISDAPTRIGTFIRTATDALTLSDVATRIKTTVRTAADALSLSDASVRVLTSVRTAVDALGLADAATRTVTLFRSVAQALSLSDAATRSITLARTAADSLNLADAATRVVTLLRTASDGLSASDTVTGLKVILRTVSDALGLSDAATRSVSLVRSIADALSLSDVATRIGTFLRNAGVEYIAQDSYNRSVGAGSLGTADLGGAWTIQSAAGASEWSVNGSSAQIDASGTVIRQAALGSISAVNHDITQLFTAEAIPTGGNIDFGPVARSAGVDDYYYMRVELQSDLSPIRLRGLRRSGGTTANLGSNFITSLTFDPAKAYWVRFQCYGTNPTTLNGKVWEQGTDEPTNWQFTVTDSTAALQTAGPPGWRISISNTATNVPPYTFTADNFGDRTIGDSLTFSEVATGLKVILRTVSDALGLSDSASRVLTSVRTAADALSLADASTRVLTAMRSATDALNLSDAATGLKVIIRTVTDSITHSDAATRTVSLFRSVTQSLNLADVATRAVTYPRTVADSLGLSDSASRVVTFIRSAVDHISFSESVDAAQQIIQRFATEVLGLADSATRNVVNLRNVVDALSLSDVASAVTVLIRSATDALGLSDSASRVVTFARSATDSITHSDVVTRSVDLFRSAQDALSLVDDAVIAIAHTLTTGLKPILRTADDLNRLADRGVNRVIGIMTGRTRSGKPPRRLR